MRSSSNRGPGKQLANYTQWTLLLLVLSCSLGLLQGGWAAGETPPHVAAYHNPADAYNVAILRLEWLDATRSRHVPAKVDHPRIAADQYLLVLQDGTHMTFAGAPRLRGGGTNDAVFHELIRQSSTAFWEAYLQHRATAKTWLVNGGFATTLGEHGTFEKKLKAP